MVSKQESQAKKGRKSKFKSLIIEKDFEPENPKQLEELDESSCKWPIGHPDEKSFYFCGRSSLKDFSYCKLHLLYAYQPKGKKEEANELQVRADLMIVIRDIVHDKGWKQEKTAKILNLTQPRVSELIKGFGAAATI